MKRTVRQQLLRPHVIVNHTKLTEHHIDLYPKMWLKSKYVDLDNEQLDNPVSDESNQAVDPRVHHGPAFPLANLPQGGSSVR